ncbi:hypothetical protein ANN_04458 [Periplaneta americana]|uniref:Uncharacterized protein n=1 Tax=Periplaneta americana TaxID=6978 RepID=A0ABQ8TAJ4_PERAM|nr:hypothetical protein ANN_04458 [Periplaneta americana]
MIVVTVVKLIASADKSDTGLNHAPTVGVSLNEFTGTLNLRSFGLNVVFERLRLNIGNICLASNSHLQASANSATSSPPHTTAAGLKTILRYVLDIARVIDADLTFQNQVLASPDWKDMELWASITYTSGRQHTLKCAKGKRSRPMCPVVQEEECESKFHNHKEQPKIEAGNVRSHKYVYANDIKFVEYQDLWFVHYCNRVIIGNTILKQELKDMWIWRTMERVKWTDRIRDEAVLERMSEERMMLKLIWKKRRN